MGGKIGNGRPGRTLEVSAALPGGFRKIRSAGGARDGFGPDAAWLCAVVDGRLEEGGAREAKVWVSRRLARAFDTLGQCTSPIRLPPRFAETAPRPGYPRGRHPPPAVRAQHGRAYARTAHLRIHHPSRARHGTDQGRRLRVRQCVGHRAGYIDRHYGASEDSRGLRAQMTRWQRCASCRV